MKTIRKYVKDAYEHMDYSWHVSNNFKAQDTLDYFLEISVLYHKRKKQNEKYKKDLEQIITDLGTMIQNNRNRDNEYLWYLISRYFAVILQRKDWQQYVRTE